MRSLVLTAVVVAVLALVVLVAYAARQRRVRAAQWAALPARWTVEILDRAGHAVGEVQTVAMLHLCLPDGEVLDRHQVTSTLLTAEDANYVPRVSAMRQQAQDEADTRNRRRRLVQEESQRHGRLVVPHTWTI